MTTERKLIEKLEELVTILYRMKDDSGLGYPPSKFIKDINRAEELESEIYALESELAKEQEPKKNELPYIINKNLEDDINTPFFGNSGARPDKITDADIEAWAIEQSYTKNSWRYKALIEGAKAVLNNEIKHNQGVQ